MLLEPLYVQAVAFKLSTGIPTWLAILRVFSLYPPHTSSARTQKHIIITGAQQAEGFTKAQQRVIVTEAP